MRFSENIKKTQQRLCHGGCEVLRVWLDLPTGETVAAKHFSAVMAALEEYAKATIFPAAVGELEALAAQGRAHTFRRHRYRATLSEQTGKRGHRITLHVTHSRDASDGGEEILFYKEVHTLWSKNGDIQRKIQKKAYNGI